MLRVLINKNIIRYPIEQKTRTNVVHKNVIQDFIRSEIIKVKKPRNPSIA